jgi:hypothetical protein
LARGANVETLTHFCEQVYFQARARLAKFRRNYAALQETGPLSLLTQGRIKTFDLTSIEHLVIALFLTSLGTMIVLRHCSTRCSGWIRGRQQRAWLAGTFVLVHVTAYYVLGCKMLHLSRAAALVSLHGLGNMVASIPLISDDDIERSK